MIKARGAAIIPDGIKFSKEENDFWDELTKEFLEKPTRKYSKSERMKFLRDCGIRIGIEYDYIKRIRNIHGDNKITKYRSKHRKTG